MVGAHCVCSVLQLPHPHPRPHNQRDPQNDVSGLPAGLFESVYQCLFNALDAASSDGAGSSTGSGTGSGTGGGSGGDAGGGDGLLVYDDLLAISDDQSQLLMVCTQQILAQLVASVQAGGSGGTGTGTGTGTGGTSSGYSSGTGDGYDGGVGAEQRFRRRLTPAVSDEPAVARGVSEVLQRLTATFKRVFSARPDGETSAARTGRRLTSATNGGSTNAVTDEQCGPAARYNPKSQHDFCVSGACDIHGSHSNPSADWSTCCLPVCTNQTGCLQTAPSDQCVPGSTEAVCLTPLPGYVLEFAPPNVTINEFAVGPLANGAQNPDGGVSGWFELFNHDDTPVDLGGWTVETYDSDHSGEAYQTYVFPTGSVVAPCGFLVAIADGSSPPYFEAKAGSTVYHMPFNLTASLGELKLTDPTNKMQDEVVWAQSQQYVALPRVIDVSPTCPAIDVTTSATTAGASCAGGAASGSPTCTFSCASGYTIVGSGSITCGSDGE